MLTGLTLGQIGIVLVSILISMAIHEAMHAFMAHWLGDTTARDAGRLSLNPLKHVDLYTTVLLPVALIILGLPPFFVAKPVPFNPDRVKFGEYGAALVGVVGPLTNFVLAALAAIVFRSWGVAADADIYNALLIFIQVNIGFFVFNMIPFPPLDGSRLVYAFAPEWLQRVMYQIESAGLMAIIVFMLLLFQFISPVINNAAMAILRFLIG